MNVGFSPVQQNRSLVTNNKQQVAFGSKFTYSMSPELLQTFDGCKSGKKSKTLIKEFDKLINFLKESIRTENPKRTVTIHFKEIPYNSETTSAYADISLIGKKARSVEDVQLGYYDISLKKGGDSMPNFNAQVTLEKIQAGIKLIQNRVLKAKHAVDATCNEKTSINRILEEFKKHEAKN